MYTLFKYIYPPTPVSNNHYMEILTIKKPNIRIYISEDTCINCYGKYNLWQKFWLWLFLGWKVKSIKD